MKSVSTDMARGQMQLSMEETVARKDRDVRAIQWLIDNLTEDAEIENFLSAIPGSFNTDRGTEVWRKVGKHHESEDQSQDEPDAGLHRDTIAHRPSSSWSIRSTLRPVIHLVRKPAPRHPLAHAMTSLTCSSVPHPPDVHRHSTSTHTQGENVVHELGTRVARSVEICKNRKLFANNDGLWRKRTRACVEATASLVCFTNAKLAWFGGISKLLGDIGSFEKIRELSLAGTDELFVMRWTCLSLVAIRQILADNEPVQMWARQTMESMGWFAMADNTGNHDALAAAQKINETLRKASDCLFRLYNALPNTEDLTEPVKEILRRHEPQISELEQIDIEAERLGWTDIWIIHMQNAINRNSHQIISQFLGILDDLDPAPVPFSRFVELSRDCHKRRFIRPGKTLKSMCSPSLTLRNVLEGQGDADAYKELLKNLENFRLLSCWQGDEMQRQLWRLQDLGNGGGLGFTVELFFLALSQLLSASPSEEPHFVLYTGTFRAITSDWSKHKHLLETQKLLLDIAMSRRREFDEHYPAHIVDEFLLLLGNIFEGQTGPHIDEARYQFEPFTMYSPTRFSERVLRVLTWEQAQSLAP